MLFSMLGKVHFQTYLHSATSIENPCFALLRIASTPFSLDLLLLRKWRAGVEAP